MESAPGAGNLETGSINLIILLLSVIPVMLLYASTNVIATYVPALMGVLDGFGTGWVLRSLVYWVMAIVLVILTQGRLGCESTDTSLAV